MSDLLQYKRLRVHTTNGFNLLSSRYAVLIAYRFLTSRVNEIDRIFIRSKEGAEKKPTYILTT